MSFQPIIFLFLLPIFLGIKAQCPADLSPLPYENSCVSFYNCSTGEKILENCPQGTFYNCMTQTCEAKTFDFCCPAFDSSIYFGKNGVTGSCLNGTVARDYKYEDIFYTCVDGVKILTGQCDVGSLYCEASKSCYLEDSETCTPEVKPNTLARFPVTNGILVSQAPWAICPNDISNFNDPSDCSSYYNCSSGVPNLFKCPDGYYYDCFNDACTTFSNWYCCNLDTKVKSSSLLKTNLHKCKNGRNTYLDGYENIFMECQNDYILTGDCGNLKFCNTTKSCYDPKTTNCTNVKSQSGSTSSPSTTNATTEIPSTTSTSTSSTTTSGTTNSTTSSGTLSKCFNTSVIGVYTDCTKYMYFNSSGSYTFQCKGDLYFNAFKKCCLPSNQIYTPACNGADNKPFSSDKTCLTPGKNVEDLKSCSNYFSCSNSYQIQAKTCPSGQLFDWKLAKCTSAFTANVVPGCTTSKLNQCIIKNGVRGQFCNSVAWPLSFIFKNLGNYCKNLICTLTWFI